MSDWQKMEIAWGIWVTMMIVILSYWVSRR
jgi:hypothetical protein